MNMRRGARGPWLSCSAFPKCRGRLGWNTLDQEARKTWERKLDEHEKAHPVPVIQTLDGIPVEEGYKPQLQSVQENGPAEEPSVDG
jgi:DNA topoisomerase-1